MGFQVIDVALAANVADDGTFDVPYPAGTSAVDFDATDAALSINHVNEYAPAVTLGAAHITVTWAGGYTLDKSSVVSLQLTKVDPGSLEPINAIAASYTVKLSDNGRTIKSTAGAAITVTVPASLPVGFACDIVQAGAGQITVAGAAGVTVNPAAKLKTAAQYAVASLLSIAADTFVLGGNTAA